MKKETNSLNLESARLPFFKVLADALSVSSWKVFSHLLTKCFQGGFMFLALISHSFMECLTSVYNYDNQCSWHWQCDFKARILSSHASCGQEAPRVLSTPDTALWINRGKNSLCNSRELGKQRPILRTSVGLVLFILFSSGLFNPLSEEVNSLLTHRTFCG